MRNRVASWHRCLAQVLKYYDLQMYRDFLRCNGPMYSRGLPLYWWLANVLRTAYNYLVMIKISATTIHMPVRTSPPIISDQLSIFHLAAYVMLYFSLLRQLRANQKLKRCHVDIFTGWPRALYTI